MFEDEPKPLPDGPTARAIKLQILIGLLDATLDHERHKDTPFAAPEWLVRHYPHITPADLEDVLSAGRAALARLTVR
jgi:hypothetical protein